MTLTSPFDFQLTRTWQVSVVVGVPVLYRPTQIPASAQPDVANRSVDVPVLGGFPSESRKDDAEVFRQLRGLLSLVRATRVAESGYRRFGSALPDMRQAYKC